jgi:enediyne biosynthesis protein E4
MARTARHWRLFFAIICGAGLVWGGLAWWKHYRYRSAMEEIEPAIVAGRYAIACRDLNKLLNSMPDSNGGLAYLLGSCELARGRTDAAGAAWERVPAGSAFSERALRGRMRLLQESGQLAAAERIILAAAADRNNDRTAVLVLLVPLYSTLGRVDEAQRLIENRWSHLDSVGEGALDPAIKLLRLYVQLSRQSTPVESIRDFIDRAAKLAENDDRVWLGRANLSIRTGAFADATYWLEACLRSRPDDVAVWRARLTLGVATHQVEIVQQALAHLPSAELTPREAHRSAAWLASRRGDHETERRELEELLVADPTDTNAFDRLSEIAEKAGDSSRAAELRRRKREIEGLVARYVMLHERSQPIRDAAEMADLARRLGRDFEARAFLTLAIANDPKSNGLQRRRAFSRERRSPSSGKS